MKTNQSKERPGKSEGQAFRPPSLVSSRNSFRWSAVSTYFCLSATVLAIIIPEHILRAEPGDLKWSFSGERERSFVCPAVGADGTVYIASFDHVLALDGATGAKKWEFRPILDLTRFIFSSPSVGPDGTVYIGSYGGRIYALNGATGEKRWDYNSGEDPVYSSPAVGIDGTVYVGLNSGLCALDGATGARKWQFQTAARVSSSPVLAGDGTVCVGCDDHKVYALDGASGEKKWEFTTGAPIFDSSPAIGSDGTIYISSSDHRLYALDGSSGTKKWEFDTGIWTATTPAIGPDGTVYSPCWGPTRSGGRVYALNGTTGRKKWEFSTGEFRGDNGNGSSVAVAGDGTVLVASWDSKLYALDEVTGTRKWEFQASDRIDCDPTIGIDGTVYVVSFGVVHAVEGVSPLAVSSWPKNRGNLQNTGRVIRYPPRFLDYPKRVILRESGASSLEVRVSGSPTPQLRWFHNGIEITGATGTALNIESVSRADEGLYSVVATNSLGLATNEPIVAIVSNVEPLSFAGFQWQTDAGDPYVLEYTDLLGTSANWQTLTNYAAQEPAVLYVELSASDATRFYRLNGTGGSRFTKTALVKGWWFTNAAGSRHLLEYVAEPTGWTNWQVMTNLVLPASPFLFLDYGSFNQPGRIYRSTVQ